MPRIPELVAGDCRQTMATYALVGELFDAIVTDPPYDLTSIVKRFGGANAAPAKSNGATGVFKRASAGFMGKCWDGTGIAFDPDTWRLAYDCLKPGAHLVAFGSDRTYHRMVCAIEDAGFEIRRSLYWVYGTGFIKSHNVAKGIDATLTKGSARTEDIRRAAVGDDYEPSGRGRAAYDPGGGSVMNGDVEPWTPATLEAAVWQGYGTDVKPAVEPIILARKPLDGTVAQNVLKHGVGGLNLDGCRIHGDDSVGGEYTVKRRKPGAELVATGGNYRAEDAPEYHGRTMPGRLPANLLHDGSEEVVACFPDSAGQLARARTDGAPKNNKIYGASNHGTIHPEPRGDSGSAARFFARCEYTDDERRLFYSGKANKADRAGSLHPTIKPLALMRWLVRLVTPPGGRILDPFAGSGTTLQAAYEEGFNAVGCEAEAEYCLDIVNRLAAL